MKCHRLRDLANGRMLHFNPLTSIDVISFSNLWHKKSIFLGIKTFVSEQNIFNYPPALKTLLSTDVALLY